MPLKSITAAKVLPLDLGGETRMATRLVRARKAVWRALGTRWCLEFHHSHHEVCFVDRLRVKVRCHLCGRMIIRTRKTWS